MMEFNKIRNPFPGLRPFELDESNLFFGREGQSDELVARLQRTRFLAVVGTSGSGKSSLIRAGLLPALYGGLMGDAGSSWRIAMLRPGNDPIGNLAAAMGQPEVFGADDQDPEFQNTIIETTLRRSTLGLVDATKQAQMSAHENLLIVVDQFEELFRFKEARKETGPEDDAAAFVQLLLNASAPGGVPVYVVLTMRSDFLGDCSQFAGLPEAINRGQYLIPRMSRDERRAAITGPVAVEGGEITLPLVNRLLNDVGDNPDQLPILQHALMRSWDYLAQHRRNGEPLELKHYEAIGTMSDALSLHADEAFAELPDERRRLIAEKLFKLLTERGADNRETRRPTTLAEICAVTKANEDDVVKVIDVFRAEGRSFLMPPIVNELHSDTVIDISHESLIRNWKRLTQWVNEEAESARMYRRLADATTSFGPGEFLPAGLLDNALEWRTNNNPNAAWAERYCPATEAEVVFEQVMAFIAASAQARADASAQRERQRNAELEREKREREQAEHFAEQQQRAARRLRWLVAGMAVMFLLALATAGYAMVQRRQALANARIAGEREAEALKQKEALAAALLVKERAEKAREVSDKAREISEAGRMQAIRDAQEKARIAEKEKVKAQTEQRRAETEARRNSKARKANDFFREAALYVQRGKYQDAKDSFSSAIEGYQDPDVANDEGIADATVEIGNLALAVGRQTFSRTHDFTINNVMGNLDLSLAKYDEAARIYAEPKVGALDKAAATNFSLAMNLLPFTNNTIAPTTFEQGLVESAGWNGAEGELPTFTVGAYLGSGPISKVELNYDPIGKLKNATVKHLQVSLRQYRQLFDEHKNLSGDWRTEAARTGMRKAAYQLGQFFLKQGNEESTNRAYKDEMDRQKAVNKERRQAIYYFEDLLSTYETNDVERGRLLIWLGGLHKSLGNSDNSNSDLETADKYFERALAALRRLNSSEPDALVLIGNVLDENGQGLEAVDFYQKSTPMQESQVRAADMYYLRGRVYEKSLDFGRATNCYSYGLGVYQKAFAEDKAQISPSNLFTMGSFFKELGDDNNALAAFDLVIKPNTKFKSEYFRMYTARAYTETGALLSKQNKPREALEAYRNALTIFDELAKAPGRNESKTEANTEAQRVRVIVSALEGTVR